MKLPQLQNFLQSPANSTWLTPGHPNSASEIDLGFFIGETPNQDIFAMGEAMIIETGNDKNGLGHYIVQGSSYDANWDVYGIMGHFVPGSITVSRGDIVGRTTKVANMGDSGNSNGPHVHLYLVFVPKGQGFSWDYATKEDNRAHALNHVFEAPGQYARGLKKMPSNWVVDTDVTPAPTPERDDEWYVGNTVTLPPVTIYDDNSNPFPSQPTREHQVKIVQETALWFLLEGSPEVFDNLFWVKKQDLGITTVVPQPAPQPEYVVPDRTGKTLVIKPQYLVGDKRVILTDRTEHSYGYDNGIQADLDPRERRYTIVEQVEDGFYRIEQQNSTDRLVGEVYVRWRPGIDFE